VTRKHLSVIIPTLSRPQTAVFLAARICDLLPRLDVEVIVVQPAGVPMPADSATVRFIQDAGRGVYMAYRAGLEHATGEYCWFMGDDDYPLDAAARLSDALLTAKADLLVAPVLFSSGRIYRPTRSRLILQFLNWCQQGVIYRRRVLMRHRFFRRLPVQADQYVNILLRTDPKVRTEFLSEPICVFGVAGVSGRLRDRGYRSLRKALARRTLSAGSFLLFRILLLIEPLAKRIIRIR
jgi:glycosyltransferase involved in cell wall biosynthesis